ncbi:hypothetical protein N7493_009940 [Penicillium malachiteum]|uniref:2EXR domain-containing protein n=1 Tax=Penicillium malachiteum TaxID=1324776 RepID=A0AAD6HE78_9EURO|nr:hypothetical protein N7493_009940 [Penicillium malachiteum]
MDSSFTLFPRLPSELRRMIWEACIPHRIVEFGFPWQESPEVRSARTFLLDDMLFERIYCGFGRNKMHNIRPPIISQVCGEARMIVLKSGEMRQDAYGQTKQWIDTKHDRLAWWWTPEVYNFFTPQIQMELISSFFSHAQSTNKEPVIMAHWVYPFRPTAQEIDYFPTAGDIITRIFELKCIFFCIKIVKVNTDRLQAIQSQLWGTTGEEVTQLVDAHDTAQIQKFRREMNASDPTELEFVDSALNKEKFAAQIAEWELEIKSQWLWMKWTMAWSRSFTGIDELMHVWLSSESDGDDQPLDIGLLHQDLASQFIARPGPQLIPVSNRFKPNMEHPWVKSVMEEIPTFKPVIMFRQCLKN